MEEKSLVEIIPSIKKDLSFLTKSKERQGNEEELKFGMAYCSFQTIVSKSIEGGGLQPLFM
jgi:hypothetical protein